MKCGWSLVELPDRGKKKKRKKEKEGRKKRKKA